jgi:RNA polymerase sigma-70 factor (ECF subfamily)
MAEEDAAAVVAKDREYAVVVATHRAALLRYAMRRLDEDEAVDDVVSETFAVAWRRWQDKPPKGEELFWLFGIARRVLSNARRSQSRRMRLRGRLAAERERQAESPRFSEVDVVALIEQLAELPDDDREALRLAYWERLTYREIGLILGCSENAVELRLRRARSVLRARLDAPSSPPLSTEPKVKEIRP